MPPPTLNYEEPRYSRVIGRCPRARAATVVTRGSAQLFLTALTILTILTIRHVYPKMSHVIPPRLFQTLKSDR